jgi:ribosomal-protein-alanine N-acetyltransferase
MDNNFTDHIFTSRLELVPLTKLQLEIILLDLSSFEEQIGLTVARDFFTERVQRAIRMKVEKMRSVDESRYAWLTYWLIIVKEENIGAGMLGFKGYPNKEGATEIGYGIDPAYQNKGYMSEAVKALINWAFSHEHCKVITATEVENPASSRLLEKLGANLVRQTDKSTSWEIKKY